MAYKLRLTKEEYDKIVYLHKKCGWSVRQLERHYNIPKTTIHRIISKGTGYEIIDTDSSK